MYHLLCMWLLCTFSLHSCHKFEKLYRSSVISYPIFWYQSNVARKFVGIEGLAVNVVNARDVRLCQLVGLILCGSTNPFYGKWKNPFPNSPLTLWTGRTLSIEGRRSVCCNMTSTIALLCFCGGRCSFGATYMTSPPAGHYPAR